MFVGIRISAAELGTAKTAVPLKLIFDVPTVPPIFDFVTVVLSISATLLLKLVSAATDRNSTTPASNALLSLTVPSGIRVIPLLGIAQQQGTAGDAYQQVGDGDNATVTTPVARTSNAGERETSFCNTMIYVGPNSIHSCCRLRHRCIGEFDDVWLDRRSRALVTNKGAKRHLKPNLRMET